MASIQHLTYLLGMLLLALLEVSPGVGGHPLLQLSGVGGRSLPQLSAEWHQWKADHGKGYVSEREELYRHVVWQSNKKLVDAHNQFNETFGYTLAMNGMGDLVR